MFAALSSFTRSVTCQLIFSLFLITLFSASSVARERILEAESAVVNEGTVTSKGQRIPYRATTGTMPVWNDNGDVIASLFYVYYERSDVRDRTGRPLVFSFNGAPPAGTPAKY